MPLLRRSSSGLHESLDQLRPGKIFGDDEITGFKLRLEATGKSGTDQELRSRRLKKNFDVALTIRSANSGVKHGDFTSANRSKKNFKVVAAVNAPRLQPAQQIAAFRRQRERYRNHSGRGTIRICRIAFPLVAVVVGDAGRVAPN